MAGRIKLHNFKGQAMTASQIAHAHALSLPTIMRRLNQGLQGDALVAPPYTHPRMKGLTGGHVASERKLTPGEAKYHLRRMIEAQERHSLHYLNAIKARDGENILARLKLALDKAESSVSYWRERVRMSERDQERVSPANLSKGVSVLEATKQVMDALDINWEGE